MFSKVFAAGLLALFAQSALAATCARSYTVQEGDWCDTISASKNVSTYQLAVVNPTINEACTNLIPGDTLCLGNTSEDCATTYTVKADDSCTQIASNHALNSTIFGLNNPNINEACNNIYIGEVLCVASTVQVPPTPAGTIPASVIPPGATPAVSSTSSILAPTASSTLAVVTSSQIAVATSSTIAPPSTTTAADDDDSDCEDDDDSTSTFFTSSSFTATSSPATSTSTEDDDDLPFCDEL